MLDRDDLREALTFDDVLLVPGESDVLPKTVETVTRLTRNIQLNIPLCSAAMDTVTEARMASAMAAAGGLGFIHKNLSVAAQAAEVAKVKRYESAIVADPVTIEPEARLAHAVALMREHGISGVPVTRRGRLVGILTNRDLRFERNLEQRVEEVMTKDLVTAREGVTIEQAKDLLHRHRIEKLLVVNEAFELKGLITIKDIEKVQQHPNAAKDQKGRLICRAAEKHGVPIISDGGVKYSGDVVKALAAGAASVMIGSLLAGTEEAPGEVILYQGRSYKSYRGMGSIGAMKEGSKDRYFQSEVSDADKLVPEGIEGRVPYKGSVEMTIFQLVGGLRSGMGYLGCRTIQELRQKPRFVRISAAGLRESHVHDVIIEKEAPNYRAD